MEKIRVHPSKVVCRSKTLETGECQGAENTGGELHGGNGLLLDGWKWGGLHYYLLRFIYPSRAEDILVDHVIADTSDAWERALLATVDITLDLPR